MADYYSFSFPIILLYFQFEESHLNNRLEEDIVDIGEKLKASFKNDYSILFLLQQTDGCLTFCPWPGAIAQWVSEESSDFIFLFISNRLCNPWGVGDWWNETLGWETNYASLHG